MVLSRCELAKATAGPARGSARLAYVSVKKSTRNFPKVRYTAQVWTKPVFFLSFRTMSLQLMAECRCLLGKINDIIEHISEVNKASKIGHVRGDK